MPDRNNFRKGRFALVHSSGGAQSTMTRRRWQSISVHGSRGMWRRLSPWQWTRKQGRVLEAGARLLPSEACP